MAGDHTKSNASYVCCVCRICPRVLRLGGRARCARGPRSLDPELGLAPEPVRRRVATRSSRATWRGNCRRRRRARATGTFFWAHSGCAQVLATSYAVTRPPLHDVCGKHSARGRGCPPWVDQKRRLAASQLRVSATHWGSWPVFYIPTWCFLATYGSWTLQTEPRWCSRETNMTERVQASESRTIWR